LPFLAALRETGIAAAFNFIVHDPKSELALSGKHPFSPMEFLLFLNIAERPTPAFRINSLDI
jgi:hypothetical protein